LQPRTLTESIKHVQPARNQINSSVGDRTPGPLKHEELLVVMKSIIFLIGRTDLTILVAAFSVAAIANAMAGGQGTAEQRAACAPDALRLCSSEIPDVARVTACMKANRSNLSAGCRATFPSASASRNPP
jgi:hypothetical protein